VPTPLSRGGTAPPPPPPPRSPGASCVTSRGIGQFRVSSHEAKGLHEVLLPLLASVVDSPMRVGHLANSLEHQRESTLQQWLSVRGKRSTRVCCVGGRREVVVHMDLVGHVERSKCHVLQRPIQLHVVSNNLQRTCRAKAGYVIQRPSGPWSWAKKSCTMPRLSQTMSSGVLEPSIAEG
jgi:hypothetical protein